MAYSHEIELLLGRLSQDKGIHPKWRNKAVARLEEAQAFINQGIRGEVDALPAQDPNVCICKNGTYRRDCPIHGKLVA